MIDPNKIDEITKGINEHLKRLEAFTEALRDVKISLLMMRDTQEKIASYELSKIKRDVAELGNNLKKYGLPTSSNYEKSLEEIRELFKNENWPHAVDPALICDNEEKAAHRANGILDILVGEPIKDKKILDFGCGEGQTIPAAKVREAALAVGYDIDADKYKFDKADFTDNFKEVEKKGPFDIVLLHDVLDHVVGMDPVHILQQAKSVLSNDGRIYLRNHPWSSRHGGHLYLKNNLAFLHLILDEFELMRCEGLQVEHNVKVTTPLQTYKNWIDQAGLSIKNELVIKSEVEDFFLNKPAIQERLSQHWSNPELIKVFMEIDFVEYVLEKPKDISHQPIY
jgi:SAM-dependent methyltransferase